MKIPVLVKISHHNKPRAEFLIDYGEVIDVEYVCYNGKEKVRRRVKHLMPENLGLNDLQIEYLQRLKDYILCREFADPDDASLEQSKQILDNLLKKMSDHEIDFLGKVIAALFEDGVKWDLSKEKTA